MPMVTILDEFYQGLSPNPSENLENAARILANRASADLCALLEMKNGIIRQVASWGTIDFEPCLEAIETAAETKKVCVRSVDGPEGDAPQAIMCMPIIVDHWEKLYEDSERRKSDDYDILTDFLYISKKDGINADGEGFSGDLLDEIDDIINLLANCLKYNSITQEASLDELTGTLNRKFLDAALEHLLYEASSEQSVFSVIMADIDSFKVINDDYGHLAGDEVLRSISEIIRSSIGKKDILGRYGGEEFVVLMRGSDPNSAFNAAESIRQRISGARLLGDRRAVSASFGVASYPEHAGSVKTLLEMADKSLYMAKKTGRNKSVLWQEDFHDLAMEKVRKQQDFFSGDHVRDANRALSLYKIMETARLGINLPEKAAIALQEALVTSGATSITFFKVSGGKIADSFNAVLTGNRHSVHNEDVLMQVIKWQKPLHIIDWDNEQNEASAELTDWQSVAVAPAVYRGKLRGVLYAGISIKVNVFKDDDLSYLYSAATIIASMMD